MAKTAQSPGKSGPRSRDLERTKARLLAAALAEFVARGFAGARTKAIARRARVHEWMVFYCFGSKQNLYREVMRGKLAERTRMMARMPDDLAAAMAASFKFLARNRDVIRLFEWEALTARKGELLGAEERREAFAQAKVRLHELQERGKLPAGADLEATWMSIVALNVFPVAFPQLVQLATGLDAGDEKFQQRWVRHLQRFAQFLASDRGLADSRRAPASADPARPADRGSDDDGSSATEVATE